MHIGNFLYTIHSRDGLGVPRGFRLVPQELTDLGVRDMIHSLVKSKDDVLVQSRLCPDDDDKSDTSAQLYDDLCLRGEDTVVGSTTGARSEYSRSELEGTPPNY